MTMTREDALRELELLPVWKLRAPKEILFALPTITETVIAATIEAAPTAGEDLAATVFEMTLSQDKKWAFIYKPADRLDTRLQARTGMSESSGMLLSNILQALHIDKPVKSQVQNLTEIRAQVIVVMGETVAQKLLNSQDSIENLRRKLHKVADSKVVVTDDLIHLLANPLDKARAWQDLCLARSAIESLC
jgi:uracil-DNA glycosylase